ncbi:hypothetical protein HU200_055388 [Digitaria exilis]|uniref:Dirigent protein n=1 Tax=Digitaria exilis TaxID=1010633 RepID=A0A835AJ03_9POAL|nr:hypothetical protein HU200_055388 [Digitaria exilis]CAB3491415.1 unnamed protein product [Digitaria exilis]
MANVKPTVQLLLALTAITAIAHGETTTTHLHFYMHDTQTPSPGSPATAVLVARGPTPSPVDPTNRFGDAYVIDDPLTEGPDLTSSRTVGRAQGFYLAASQSLDALLLSVNMVFTAGRHNGSSVTVMGRDAIFNEVRELPVLGGTGVFRGAGGYIQIRTHSFNISNGNAVLKVDVFISV